MRIDMNRTRLTSIFLFFIFFAAYVADVILTHEGFTSRLPGGNDSLPRYVGAQAWLFEGINPYSDEVMHRSQEMMYGRLAAPGEDKQRFAYPFYTIFFYLPLAFFSWDWAQAIGIATLEFAFVIMVILSLRLYRWKPPLWLFVLTLLSMLFMYHEVRTIFLVQFAGIAALLIVLSLWALKERYDILAGIVLALSSAKPQMSFLIIPLLGIWGLLNKRWHFLASLAITMFILLGLSFAFVPTWLFDFIPQLADYTTYTAIGSPLNILTTIVFPSLNPNVEYGLIGLFLIWLLWEWWRVRHKLDGRQLDWVIALTLIITNLVVTRTATTNYIMMLPALFLVFKIVSERYGVKANGWIAVSEIILLVGIWVLFAFTVQGNQEQWQVYFPLPFGLLIAMIIFKPKADDVELSPQT